MFILKQFFIGLSTGFLFVVPPYPEPGKKEPYSPGSHNHSAEVKSIGARNKPDKPEKDCNHRSQNMLFEGL